MSDELEAARRKMVRYRILKILDSSRPVPVGEGLIGSVLVDADLQVTHQGIRRSLQYLHDIDYIDLDQTKPHWEARLMPDGVDYLENPSIEHTGIARPAIP